VRVALLSTGSEILQGLYPDTNAQWLAARLDALGFDVVAIRSVGDDLEPTLAALGSLSSEADLILTTGGLGPTEDDRLREACATHWRRALVHSAEMERQIAALFRRRRRPMPTSNRRQALIPRGADPLPNRWGTAPGFAIAKRGKLPALVTLPGPPVEMRPMFEKRALPWLREHLWPGVVRGRTVIHTIGWPEARVNEALADLFDADPRLSLTLLARSGKIDVRLTATAEDKKTVRSMLTHWRRVAQHRLPRELVWGRDDETLEEIVNRLLVRAGWTIAVAESCTGGLIAQRLTAVPGASRVLERSVITYADEAKRGVLGVSAATLRRHGAVSEECVREMAEGVRRWAKADIGLSVSGIAGPTGGTPEKPVGLVWIAAATACETVAERHQIFRRERDAIRLWAADRALDLARRIIQGRSAKPRA
jgi:competence/damage-inducible protein CinA-like protein